VSGAPSTWSIGAIEITRVEDPDFELILPSDESTIAALRESPWLAPSYVTDDWSLNIGSSCTVVRTPDATVLVDPFLAFDDAERLGARLQALRDAGVEADAVDVVVNTHVDGIGANVLHDGSPAFPGARYLVPRAELDAMRAGTHVDTRAGALLALQEAGVVEPTDAGSPVVEGLHLEDAPGHNPGMHVVWVRDGGAAAVVVGHLFLHPAQVASPHIDNGDLDPVALKATRRALLERCVADDAVLVGPLFASPGGGRVQPTGSTWSLVPA
jgi:glyoxylase-like metal-dependent hydrolase (beta-lactamase superfamily II)